MLTAFGVAAVLCSCGQGGQKNEPVAQNDDFHYLLDEFADLKVMRYQVPGWDDLTLRQKEYAYHLSEAAKYGRDITWDQYCKWNLPIRHAVEDIINEYNGGRESEDFKNFLVYAKRLFFSNGIHHHYAEDKFFPACSKEYFKSLLEAVGYEDNAEVLPDTTVAGASRTDKLLTVIYSKDIYPQRRSTSQDGDIVALSAVNFYDGVTRKEVDDFYNAMTDPNDTTPISYGLNSKVVKKDGKVIEEPWKVGGIYSGAIEKIVDELGKAAAVAENDIQKKALNILMEYYKTGDLKLWDDFNVEWVQDTIGTVDFINGFIEDYDDPLGRKATWEGYVNIKDSAASARTEVLSANAQWFEDNSPVDPRFKKPVVKGVSAKVVNAVALAGATYPSTPIGINLPNADWIRRDYGSKSVTIANITHAYDKAALESPNSTLKEFAYSQEEIDRAKKYGDYADEVHTDLHECLGHGSGQLLPGVSSTALGEYQSTLEEARADLFGLYYSADPKLVELGIMPDAEAYKAEYDSYIRNGLMVQLSRIELGNKITEAHMQNRKLIAEWCYEKGAANNVIQKIKRDGKTYFVVNDYDALRGLFAQLLAEIQRIKSEGDYKAGKNLVETYAVNVDRQLHEEVIKRYEALNLKPYGGFVNPDIVPVEKDGKVVDYKIVYVDDYLQQQLDYGKKYRTL
jgi:dipeptidyl-peptidase-3